MDGLTTHKIPFSYSNYHPHYEFFDRTRSNSPVNSWLYSMSKYLSWGISNRIKVLRKNNRHLNVTYSVYDYVTARNIQNPDVLFCWPQVSLYTAKKVKNNGGKVIMDYPIPHIHTWEKWLNEEKSSFGLPNMHSTFSSVIAKRMLKEIELVDLILVPSRFVYDSFIDHGVASDKLVLNNYGIDTNYFTPVSQKSEQKKLSVLFVGTVEIRKGVHYLLDAVKKLNGELIELRIAGTFHSELYHLIHQSDMAHKNIRLLGQLPKDQIKEEMNKADVMVMPSMLEGLSLTILEGMACGTPVISTWNAGGPEVIEDMVNGFLIPPRDVSALSEKLNWCIEHKDELEAMGLKARAKILDKNTKEHYINRTIHIIKSI